jgi:hypothetical protein
VAANQPHRSSLAGDYLGRFIRARSENARPQGAENHRATIAQALLQPLPRAMRAQMAICGAESEAASKAPLYVAKVFRYGTARAPL